MNVVVRVRPSFEGALGDAVQVPSADTIVVCKDNEEGANSAVEFKFAHIFTPECETADVYDHTLQPIVSNVLKGTPGCLFAYGQTGSGKTHTVTGSPANPGVLAMAVDEILRRTAADESVVTSCVYLTYLEVYNEVIRDLLNPDGPTLNLREDANGRPHLPNMARVPVSSVEDAMAIVNKGEQLRAKCANSVHEHSSRSHAVFTITVETRRQDEAKIRIGLLHVIDLAGSETAHAPNTTAMQDAQEAVQQRMVLGDIGNKHIIERERKNHDARHREGSHIRKSLLALIRCVQKMADRAPFIPFRDSNLTRLLRAPLEGNSNTAIVCTVNPSECKETIATLRFAATAQRIHRTPANKVVTLSTEGSLLKSYERELSQLRTELSKNIEEERQRNAELLRAKADKSTELARATAEREALRQRLEGLNSKLLKTEKKAQGPPTPRTCAKIAFAEGRHADGQKRSSSAPRRRGAIFPVGAEGDAKTAEAPKYVRDAASRAAAERLKERDAALEQAEKERMALQAQHLEALSARAESESSLRAELERLRAAVRIADQERDGMHAFLTRLQEKPKKKSGLSCSKGKPALKEDPPQLRKIDAILASL